MKNKCKISIIVPVYNTENYIKQCVDSILNQNFQDFQLLLINDGSTDSSGAICAEYANKDSRVTVIHQNNSGVSIARNRGLDLAQGDWICFVDSDDIIDVDYLSVLYNNANELDVDLLSTSLINNDGSTKVYSQLEALNMLVSLNFATSLWLSIYKKDLFLGTRLNENIHFYEDLEFQYRLLLKAGRIGVINRILYDYKTREGSANNSEFNNKVLSVLEIPISLNNFVVSHKHEQLLWDLAIKQTVFYFLKSQYSKRYFRTIKKVLLRNIRNWLFNRSVQLKYKLIYLCFIASNKRLLGILSVKYKKRITYEN